MLSYLWSVMLLAGIVFGACTGNFARVGVAAVDSGKEAIQLCLTMAGVMAMWMGFMEVAKRSGLINGLTRRMKGMIGWLFPGIPRSHASREYIAMNLIANLLGIGNAATPAGIRAMEALEQLNEKPGVATDAMCTLLVLNISSLQLIPMTVIAYRSQYGSVNPAFVVGPGLVATAVSTVVGIFFCKCMQRRRKR